MSALGPSMTSGNTPARAVAAGTRSAAAARSVIRRRGNGNPSNGSQPRAGAEVSGSGRTCRGGDVEALGGGLLAPAVELGLDARGVQAALGAQDGGHAARAAVGGLAGGQQAQARAAQQDGADAERLLAAGGRSGP